MKHSYGVQFHHIFYKSPSPPNSLRILGNLYNILLTC